MASNEDSFIHLHFSTSKNLTKPTTPAMLCLMSSCSWLLLVFVSFKSQRDIFTPQHSRCSLTASTVCLEQSPQTKWRLKESVGSSLRLFDTGGRWELTFYVVKRNKWKNHVNFLTSVCFVDFTLYSYRKAICVTLI